MGERAGSIQPGKEKAHGGSQRAQAPDKKKLQQGARLPVQGDWTARYPVVPSKLTVL